jgi:hypothetical protein
LLLFIFTGNKHVTKRCWGGEQCTTVVVTTFKELGRMQIMIPSTSVPRGTIDE